MFFLNACNSYNRSLLKMYVVAYETSSKPEKFYWTMPCLWIMFVTAVCFLLLLKLKWPKNKNISNFILFLLLISITLSRSTPTKTANYPGTMNVVWSFICFNIR